MIKAIIFDFDGTIADTIPSTEQMAEVFNRLAHDLHTRKLTKEEIEKFRDYRVQLILRELKIPIWRVPFLLTKIQSELKKELSLAKPVDDIKPVLQYLKAAGYILGILTSSRNDVVDSFLKRNSMTEFDFIYTDTSLFGKDKMIKHLLNAKKFKSDEILYIGDEIRDIEAAKKVNVSIVSVTWGFNSRKGLETYKPTFLIDTPKELLSVITQAAE